MHTYVFVDRLIDKYTHVLVVSLFCFFADDQCITPGLFTPKSNGFCWLVEWSVYQSWALVIHFQSLQHHIMLVICVYKYINIISMTYNIDIFKLVICVLYIYIYTLWLFNIAMV